MVLVAFKPLTFLLCMWYRPNVLEKDSAHLFFALIPTAYTVLKTFDLSANVLFMYFLTNHFVFVQFTNNTNNQVLFAPQSIWHQKPWKSLFCTLNTSNQYNNASRKFSFEVNQRIYSANFLFGKQEAACNFGFQFVAATQVK